MKFIQILAAGALILPSAALAQTAPADAGHATHAKKDKKKKDHAADPAASSTPAPTDPAATTYPAPADPSLTPAPTDTAPQPAPTTTPQT